ncbi:piggyBac transposable element-derived protein 4-like [Macrobrachium rosenbergii]|uniref:piggyBac transposable element-derived protein 4-like n=1 Tax=Macrobrachium rosenbergii TaxID=79674 RepID=UPI0034D7A5F2
MRPHKHLAVDEALILWKGRLGFRQFIKTKRSRFGVKAFVLSPSDSQWSGYSWNFSPYYGKDIFQVENYRNLTVSERIVVYFMDDLLDKGRRVVTDNWYMSLRLCEYLETRDTLLTGVVRSGRGPPRSIMNERLERHQSVFARKGNVVLVKWQDKKEVAVISTKYEGGMVERTKTYFGNRTVFVNKPLHIEKYNEKMGSVDIADQLLESYDHNRKSMAWFKKIGLHFMFRMALNGRIALQATGNYNEDFMKFLLDVQQEILCEYSIGVAALYESYQLKKGPTMKVSVSSDTHQFVKNEKGQKRCRINYPKRKDTRYHCPACPGSPGLCSMEHYRKWHQQDNPDDPQPGRSTTKQRGQGQRRSSSNRIGSEWQI